MSAFAPKRSSAPASDAAESGASLSAAVLLLERERDLLTRLAAGRRLAAVVDPSGQPDVYAELCARAARLPAIAHPIARTDPATPAGAIFPWLLAVDEATLAWLEQTPAPDGDGARNPFGAAAPSTPPVGPVIARGACGLYIVPTEPGTWFSTGHVQRQLRRLLTVRLPEGDRVHLRIADPVTLPAIWSVSTADELELLFGSAISALVVARPTDPFVEVYARAARPPHLPRPTVYLPSGDPGLTPRRTAGPTPTSVDGTAHEVPA